MQAAKTPGLAQARYGETKRSGCPPTGNNSRVSSYPAESGVVTGIDEAANAPHWGTEADDSALSAHRLHQVHLESGR